MVRDMRNRFWICLAFTAHLSLLTDGSVYCAGATV
jgi:hypothetical protein